LSKKSNINRPELVIALVAPTGTRLSKLERALEKVLKTVKYKSVNIKISDLIKRSPNWKGPKEKDEYNRIRLLQEEGNKFREDGSKFWENIDGSSEKEADGAALARAAIVAIREHRIKNGRKPDEPCEGTAYILNQLKHPDEVSLLRDVYGSSFFLIGGHAPRDVRQNYLASIIAKDKGLTNKVEKFISRASEVIEVDEKQDGPYEQNTRDSYPKADFFINLGVNEGENQITRFIELIFGHPFHSPSQHEYAMYHAKATSLRSSDQSRQVGAVISTDISNQVAPKENIDIIAVGCNEVPFGGGGLYWPGKSPDLRDQKINQDYDNRAEAIKRSILIELLEKMEILDMLKNKASEIADKLLDNLQGTQFQDIGEFGRMVHAEMAALIDAARRGVSVDNHAMYVTTFPCHNCAKHIIAAGIRKVIYLEPYPKSRTKHLHAEEVEGFDLVAEQKSERTVEFLPFAGVAPRQYSRLFSMTKRGPKKYISLEKWESEDTSHSPQYVERNASKSYMASEREELKKIPDTLFDWDIKKLLP